MPNYCNYSMCVNGKNKENVKEFINIIQANYSYGTMEFSYDKHLFRVFEAEYNEIEEMADGSWQVIIDGYCAWSVNCCMFDTYSLSYYNSIKEKYPDNFRGTTIPIESKRLNLNIEIYSEECGMCFQEHYKVINGDVVCNECVDFNEYCISEFETKEEAEEELGITITDKEWENKERDEWITRGGFENWDFEI